MTVPKPHDPRESGMSPAEVVEKLNGVLSQPAETLAQEAELLHRAHEILHEALQ